MKENTNGINSFALLLCLFICFNMERTLNYLIKNKLKKNKLLKNFPFH